VKAELAADIGENGSWAFFARLIDAVELRRLGVGGGGGGSHFGWFVVRLGRGSADEADREALAAFLGSDPAVVQHAVGPLVDAWH
jgi:uncharacterized protein YggL (DUF469 family)